MSTGLDHCVLVLGKTLTPHCGRHGGTVRVPDPRSSGPGLSPGRGHCAAFIGKTLKCCHSVSLHPGV